MIRCSFVTSAAANCLRIYSLTIFIASFTRLSGLATSVSPKYLSFLFENVIFFIQAGYMAMVLRIYIVFAVQQHRFQNRQESHSVSFVSNIICLENGMLWQGIRSMD